MKNIAGQIRIYETGYPPPPLLVHFYFAEPFLVPPHVLDEAQWDDLYRAAWKGFNASRLGSVHSDADGQFSFDYDSTTTSMLPRDARAPNLWLAVTGQDLSDAHACPKVLHASCEIRVGAGARESFLIYVSEKRLRRLGLIGGTSSAALHQVSLPELYDNLDAVAALAQTPDLGGQSFSKFFAKRRKELKAEIAKLGVPRVRQATFVMKVGLANAKGDPLDKSTKIERDDQARGLMIRTADDGRGKRLRYKGIDRESTGQAQDGRPPSLLRIDETSGAFVLAMARVPEDLRVIDNEPSALFVR